MTFAFGIKMLLQGLQKAMQTLIWRKTVIPAIDRAALKDVEDATSGHSATSQSDGITTV